ncbi:winged helix-turn-helix domain-containing protein [Halomonas denitrificans]|nr:winged helix-turn-helix domain-containing protein [Halomonas denitrificans]
MAQIRFSGLEYDPSDGSLQGAGGGAQTLRPQVATLLEAFLARPGQVIDRESLCRAVWGEDRVVDFESGLSALVKELRHALRATGAPDELLETVPRRGYRFHADPRTEPADPSPAASGSAPPDPGGSEPPMGRRRRRAAALVIVLGMAALLAWWVIDRDEAADPVPRLAVVPFEMLGDPAVDATNLDLVLADTLLAALWQAELDGLVLIGRTSMGDALTGRDRTEFVAAELGASLVLEGSLIPDRLNDRDGWRIEARLLRLPRGEVVWTGTAVGDPGAPVSAGAVAETLVADLVARWPELRAEGF